MIKSITNKILELVPILAKASYMNYMGKPFSEISKKVETSLMLPSSNMVMLPGVALPMTLTDSYSIGVVEAALFSNHKQFVVGTIRPEIQRRFEKEKKV